MEIETSPGTLARWSRGVFSLEASGPAELKLGTVVGLAQAGVPEVSEAAGGFGKLRGFQGLPDGPLVRSTGHLWAALRTWLWLVTKALSEGA